MAGLDHPFVTRSLPGATVTSDSRFQEVLTGSNPGGTSLLSPTQSVVVTIPLDSTSTCTSTNAIACTLLSRVG